MSKYICCECNKQYDESEIEKIEHNGRVYDWDCFYDHYTKCAKCGKVIPINDYEFIDDMPFCKLCSKTIYDKCNGCGEWIVENKKYINGKKYCSDCHRFLINQKD